MKMIIGPKQLQLFLKRKGFYDGMIDGLFGPKSIKAAAMLVVSEIGSQPTWKDERTVMAASQIMLEYFGFELGAIDGLYGPSTEYALEQWQNMLVGANVSSEEERAQQKTVWPTYDQMTRFYGPVGQNVQLYNLPYKMRLAWDTSEVVTRISLHKKCAESALAVLEAAREHYGMDAITKLRLDLFGGSFNVRKMRGGDKYSTHSWAAAIDIDPEHNAFRWNNKRASLAGEEYDVWWELWEAQGWVSLGRERNFDYMHIQAVRL